jgi:hypothetical protein
MWPKAGLAKQFKERQLALQASLHPQHFGLDLCMVFDPRHHNTDYIAGKRQRNMELVNEMGPSVLKQCALHCRPISTKITSVVGHAG